MKLNKYFDSREFICPCGCREAAMSSKLIDMLTNARIRAGIPFAITSGYRCPKRNEKVGGVANSSHVLGDAVDIACTSGPDRLKIVSALMKAGFVRIGIASNFIHADVDGSKPASIWHYAK